ncbi:MAG: TIGR01841 family phasin [Pseudomonadota bacterium]|nr:TIGR01841 family phasin [Pseudomonadota bacterium]MDE3037397.1 TIGR01841 family phasin [Pseudomonadota bacterium]
MTYNNAFADMFKNTFDFNQLFSTQRRNIEALSEVNQTIVEGAQAISRRQAEVIRENVENTLKASKEMMTGGSPETSLTKQAELAKEFFENALSNLREITETVTKSGFEAFDVLNKRTAETIEEFSKASSATSKKKAAA